MTRLIFAEPLLDELRPALMADQRETCAMLMVARGADGRFLVRSSELAPKDAYRRRTPTAAELSPDYLVDITRRARDAGIGLVFAHTHPFAKGSPSFSEADTVGETALAAFMRVRQPGLDHFALVIGPEGVRARRLGGGPEVRVESVGKRLLVLHDFPGRRVQSLSDIYDRQVRAFGAAGQEILASMTVAIIGLGGTGSVVAQQLCHLGIRSLVFIDPDRLETTNLNRVVGARPEDLGRSKVDVCADAMRRLRPEIQIDAHVADVTEASVAKLLTVTDFIFACTDSHASRAVIGQLAYQHLIPAIDMGVGIAARAGAVESITGRVQALVPGMACLACTGVLDGQAIRRELMTPEHRAGDPYFTAGEGEPQPAVVSINSTVSSLAVTMFLSMVVGIGGAARHQVYDGCRGTVRHVATTRLNNCLVCSPEGALARGVAHALPVRAAPRR